ncbi:MAG: NAD(P)-binding protein [Anaeromyxobacter sp.]
MFTPVLPESKKVKVTVNGRELLLAPGLTLLRALLQEGIHVPHLCFDTRLERSIGNCGLCVVELRNEARDVKACQTPVKAGMEVVTDTPKLQAYRRIRLEQLLGQHDADCVAPCVQTCPAHIDIQTYLHQVSSGNIEAALRVIKERNPFPSACGRVCPHTCEAQCRRNLVDAPVAINHVKRFVADWDMARETPFIPQASAPSGRKIAILGAGPSGLSAAYYAAIHGHEVTVFERLPEPGGMMRYGIPEYRLPKKVLDAEIDVIRALGVKILTGKSLGTHLRLEELQKTYDAVYLAIGSWRATPMQIEGETTEGVWLGIQYLEAVTKGDRVPRADRVVVIGGGNTAIDCARTALRRGAKSVQLVYRRTRDEMPAAPYEVEEALHEGVEMLFLAAPSKIEKTNGHLTLHCIRMALGEPDRSGRRRPVPVDGSEFQLEADQIVGAIGQSTNTQFLYNDLPVQLNKWGDIQVSGKTMQSSVEKVFAGGDCVTGPATVIQAVAAGRAAAESMHELLSKGFVSERSDSYACSRGRLEDLPRYEFEELPRSSRAPMPALVPTERIRSFVEVETGISEAEARAESSRCLECGCSERVSCELRSEATAHGIEHKPPVARLEHFAIVKDHPFILRDHNKCISCGRCVAACADIIGPDVLNLYVKRGRMLVGTKSGLPLNDTDCVSCGQCVNSCPCGALEYRRERDQVFRALNDKKKLVMGFVAPAVRSVISTHFGVPFNEVGGFMAGLLRKLGFAKVFDFVFAADLTIVEETTEFLNRADEGGKFPQFTSCCPGWVNFVERRYPGLIEHFSTCKSPQQMMGSTVKAHYPKWAGQDLKRDEMFLVSVVPCLAKKVEAARPEFAPDGVRDVDAVLTTSELIEMITLAGIDPREVQPGEFDEPYKQVSGAGMLFGSTGGVAEAALRMAAEKATGKVLEKLDFEEVRGLTGFKEATVQLGEAKVRLAVISGLKNAIPVLEQIKAGKDVGYDLIEVMTCPGGCIGGAGHPVPVAVGEMKARQDVLIDIDRTSKLRKSQENPDILRLYEEFYGEPNSHLAHRLLHTHYTPRGGDARAHKAVVNPSDSAFRTHELQICFCDVCAGKGSAQLFDTLTEKVRDGGLEPMVEVKPVRLSEKHATKEVYVTLDGQQTGVEQLQAIHRLVRA